MFDRAYAFIINNNPELEGYVEIDIIKTEDIQYYIDNVGGAGVVDYFQSNILPRLPSIRASIMAGDENLERYPQGTWLHMESRGVAGHNEIDDRYVFQVIYSETQNIFPGTVPTEVIYIYAEIIAATYTTQQALSRLFTLESTVDDYTCSSNMNGITSTTQFQSVEINYVGAALCCTIRETRTGSIVGLFDAGAGPPNLLAATKDTNYRALKAFIDSDPDAVLIVSHWHTDHVSILQDSINGRAAQFQRLHIFYPAYMSDGVSFSQMIAFFKKRTKLTDNVTQPISTKDRRIAGNANFVIQKIDYCYKGHPHHHGICARIKLSSGNEALLAGDCTYEGMSASLRQFTTAANTVVLQASHHGGNYAVSPANQPNKTDFIPRYKLGTPKPTNMIAVYSANGRTYRHPNRTVMAQHAAADWTGVELQLHCMAPPARGLAPNNYLVR